MDAPNVFNDQLKLLDAFVSQFDEAKDTRYHSFVTELQGYREKLQRSAQKLEGISAKKGLYPDLLRVTNKVGEVFNLALKQTSQEIETPDDVKKINDEIGELTMLAFSLKAPSLEKISKWPDRMAQQVLNYIPNSEDSCSEGVDIYHYLNRYCDIVPYNKNRFRFKEGGYYNASDINWGENQRYILASAPREKELELWWQMVIESGTRAIFTLTNDYEKKLGHGEPVEKCYPYWSQENNFKILTEKGDQKIIKRVFSISGSDVNQYHFVNWPDFGTADRELVLELQKYLAAEKQTKEHPPVIHCSAGVGRTGVLMAIHLLIQNINQGKTDVNVIDIVKQLRSLRPNMIQTGQQLKMIASVLKALSSDQL